MPTSTSLSESDDRSFLVPIIVTSSYLAIGLLAWAGLVAIRFPYTWMFGELDYKDRRALGRQERLAHSVESAKLRVDVEHAIRRCRTVAKLRYRVSASYYTIHNYDSGSSPFTVLQRSKNVPIHKLYRTHHHQHHLWSCPDRQRRAWMGASSGIALSTC